MGELALWAAKRVSEIMRKRFPQRCRDVDDTIEWSIIPILKCIPKYVEGKSVNGLKGWMIFIGIQAVMKHFARLRKRERLAVVSLAGSMRCECDGDCDCYVIPKVNEQPYYEPLLDKVYQDCQKDRQDRMPRHHYTILKRKLYNAYYED